MLSKQSSKKPCLPSATSAAQCVGKYHKKFVAKNFPVPTGELVFVRKQKCFVRPHNDLFECINVLFDHIKILFKQIKKFRTLKIFVQTNKVFV
jgi:hypothetical protein